MNDIEKLLAGGATPESIYEEALKIVKAKQEKEKENQKLNEARKNAANGFAYYLATVIGEPLEEDFVKEFENALKEAEDNILEVLDLFPNKSKKVKKPTVSEEEKILRDWLKKFA